MLQKKSHKSKTQKGGFFNKKHPSKYRNITYTKSNTGFTNPEMKAQKLTYTNGHLNYDELDLTY